MTSHTYISSYSANLLSKEYSASCFQSSAFHSFKASPALLGEENENKLNLSEIRIRILNNSS